MTTQKFFAKVIIKLEGYLKYIRNKFPKDHILLNLILDKKINIINYMYVKASK